MVFPTTPLDTKSEIYVGSWVNITTFCQNRDGITIKRGRSDETRTVDPTAVSMSLNNRDGRFSPRNPGSIYYGVIGRNTPLRISTPLGSTYMDSGQLYGGVGTASASTPDNAVLDITGDIDLRFEADIDYWNIGSTGLIGKWTESGNQRSYQLTINSTGLLALRWSADGTAVKSWNAPVEMPFTGGRHAVRVTLDVNNGTGGSTTQFYTADTLAGPWVELGGPQIDVVGTTSIFSSSAILTVGANPNYAAMARSLTGRIYKAEVYQGIAGTVRANPDFRLVTAGASSFADASGRTWTMNGTAFVSDRDFRTWSEVSEWPQKWDQSGTDVWTPLSAAGILRRLSQGAAPLPSAWRRVLNTQTDVVAYWPAEDGDDATSLGSAKANNVRAMGITGGEIEMSSYTGDFQSSEPIPVLRGAALSGYVATYTGLGACQLGWFMGVPSTGAVNGAVVARMTTTGTIVRTDVVYGTGGTLRTLCYDGDGNLDYDSGNVAYNLNGNDGLFCLLLNTSGANLLVSMDSYGIFSGDSGGIVNQAGGVNSVSAVTRVQFNPDGTLDDVAIGQIFVSNSADLYTGRQTLRDDVNAFVGEPAGSRIARLCRENSIVCGVLGDPADTSLMGYQKPMTLLELLRECEAVDTGILFEPRTFLGLQYRPRRELYNQVAAATADYVVNQLTTFEPTDDDSSTVNDVTVQRKGGASSRVTKTTGPLSISAPPSGVGLYDTSVSLSLFQDSDTEQQAGWRVALGTIDEARFPTIDFNYTNPNVLSDSVLTLELQALDIGQRLVVENPPAWLPPDDVAQIVQGEQEYLNNFEHTLSVNCAPARLYDDIGVYSAATSSGAGQSKYSSDGSVLAVGSYNSTTTGFFVTTATGPLWTTDAAQMPIPMIVAGEEVSVTAISGTTNPQTFTIVRSVNGVVKSQALGETIKLLHPAKYAL